MWKGEQQSLFAGLIESRPTHCLDLLDGGHEPEEPKVLPYGLLVSIRSKNSGTIFGSKWIPAWL